MIFKHKEFKNTHLCKLENGEILPYDFAVSIDFYCKVNLTKYKYIGKGTIYSIDGIMQAGNNQLYFYQDKER